MHFLTIRGMIHGSWSGPEFPTKLNTHYLGGNV